MKTALPVLLVVTPPLLAGIALSYGVLIPNDGAYKFILGTFAVLVLVAIVVVRGFDSGTSHALDSVLLSLFYCGSSLFLGFLIAFVLRIREVPWTMHVKDPGFGILIPLMTVGGLSLVVGIVSLVILLVRLRP